MSALENALGPIGRILMVIAGAGALIGMAVVIVMFDEFDGAAQHVAGIRVAVGLLLISVGLTALVGSRFISTANAGAEAESSLSGLGAFMSLGGRSLILIIVGALLLGVTFNAGGKDRDGDEDDDDMTAAAAR